MKVAVIAINQLHQHEQIDPSHLDALKQQIKKDQILKNPIIVDEKSLTVLDGHHRLQSCLQLGFTKIPCMLVDYLNDKKIRVSARRPEFQVSKQLVVETGLKGTLLPYKTTKHFIPKRVKGLNIKINKLV